MFLRRFWLPTSGCTMVVYAKEDPNKNKSCEPPPKEPPVVCERKKVRASELPIYLDEPPCNLCKPSEEKKELLLVNTIKTVRLEVWNLMDQLGNLKQQMSALILEAKQHADGGLEYLREESNVVPRFGAIAIGGLGGYVLALRKGKFKRFLYTTSGAGAMAALCYPTEAKEYSSLAFSNLKKYIIIGYHLFNGAEEDEEEKAKAKKKKGGPGHCERVAKGEDKKPRDPVDPSCNCPTHPRFKGSGIC